MRAASGLVADDRRYRQFVESVEDYAIVALDTDGSVASWNAGAERIYGFRAEEVVGQHARVLYPPDADERRQVAHDLELAAHAGRHEDEGWRVRRDGERLWVSTVITAV